MSAADDLRRKYNLLIRLLKRCGWGLLMWAQLSVASAETLEGLVMRVEDGDTLDLTTQSGAQTIIRLYGIDAPEKAQPYGRQSRKALRDACLHKFVRVEVLDVDRYQRVVGRVSCDGKDAGRSQITAGMAWVYRRYVAQRDPLYLLERNARQQRLGLWRDPNPVEPWRWRHARSRGAPW